MTNVLELTRRLMGPVATSAPPGVLLRTFGSDGNESADVAAWLELRRRAFANERPAVREWTAADFAREFTAKPWWQPNHCWLAIADGETLAGSATLALRTGRTQTQAVLHWLMVEPRHRRRGIGCALLSAVENQARQLGYDQLAIETHAGWQASVNLYRRHGYQ